MSDYGDTIAAIYAQVRAPLWAARNLDGLADVLRDLSWLPEGPVELRLPDLAALPPGDSLLLTAAEYTCTTRTLSIALFVGYMCQRKISKPREGQRNQKDKGGIRNHRIL